MASRRAHNWKRYSQVSSAAYHDMFHNLIGLTQVPLHLLASIFDGARHATTKEDFDPRALDTGQGENVEVNRKRREPVLCH